MSDHSSRLSPFSMKRNWQTFDRKMRIIISLRLISRPFTQFRKKSWLLNSEKNRGIGQESHPDYLSTLIVHTISMTSTDTTQHTITLSDMHKVENILWICISPSGRKKWLASKAFSLHQLLSLKPTPTPRNPYFLLFLFFPTSHLFPEMQPTPTTHNHFFSNHRQPSKTDP